MPTTGVAMNITTYRPVDTGPRTYTVTDDSYRLLGGLKGAWNGWKWDSALLYSKARTKDMTRDAISNTAFQAAVNRTDATAYNPFNGGSQPNYSLGDGTPNDRATINSFLINVYRISETSLTLADFKISKKDLFTLPGGDVGVAAGVEWRRETYHDDRDKRLDGTIKYTNSVTGVTYGTDVMGASGAPDVNAHRSVASAFFELAVPIVSPEMNIPFVEEISLQIAAREWAKLPGAGPEVVPNVHPARAHASYPKALAGRAGWHQVDTGCPIGPHTWEAALAATEVAAVPAAAAPCTFTARTMKRLHIKITREAVARRCRRSCSGRTGRTGPAGPARTAPRTRPQICN